jgi:hypothetical protein
VGHDLAERCLDDVVTRVIKLQSTVA